MKKLITCAVAATFALSCGTMEENKNKEQTTPIIGKKEIKLTSNLMTPETLWYFGRLGNVKVAPNGKQIAYTVTWYDIEQNKSNTDLYVMDADGKNQTQLTKTAQGESGVQWRPDGAYIGFTRGGQVYEIKPDGSGERQVTNLKDLEVSEFLYAPTGDKLLMTIETQVEKTTAADVYTDMPKAEAYIASDLMYRHWDTWEDGKFSHIYIAPYADGALTAEPVDINANEPYDTPLKPFGGIDDICWSPDGKTIAYTSKKLSGKEYTMTTNSNIYLYSTDSKQTTMLTEGMKGYDSHPLFSPDGKKLLWLSMEREGYEADKERIFIYDFEANQMQDISRKFDSSPSSIQWAPDGHSIYLTACFDQTFRLFTMTVPNFTADPKDYERIDLENGYVKQISKDGLFDYQNVQLIDGGFIVNRTDMTRPTEIYKIDANGEATELSFINKHILEQLNLPTVEKRYVKTTDNKQMLVWVILPPDFDKSKKYPAIMMCTGGPQGAVSQSYSFRWNFALMASKGYVTVYPARRGVSGNGQEWTDGVSKDHGGQPERDLLAAIDNVAAEPWVDKDRLGAAGASYGGFSIFWLAGNHNKRFKAFLAHAGIFDFQSMYSTTEEMFFENWEKGGAFWDKNNAAAQRSLKQSPINFIQNWDTPLFVIHGEKDYRVPYTQGIQAYNIAQMLGIPSKLMIFPNENHWILKPQNAIVWQREFFAWFDKYLKNN